MGSRDTFTVFDWLGWLVGSAAVRQKKKRSVALLSQDKFEGNQTHQQMSQEHRLFFFSFIMSHVSRNVHVYLWIPLRSHIRNRKTETESNANLLLKCKKKKETTLPVVWTPPRIIKACALELMTSSQCDPAKTIGWIRVLRQ